ncbi:MAG: HIT domain-containing protein [Lachnospiraceae bacterium]|nr:HIT domain-containing protein [Lachnospiraceae bacterium]
MPRCIFCEFIEGKTPCEKPYEDEKVSSFLDWNHLDGIHAVVFPKKHIGVKDEGSPEFEEAKKLLYDSLPVVAKAAGIQGEYRLLTEDGEDNFSQNLEHIHVHVVGEKRREESSGSFASAQDGKTSGGRFSGMFTSAECEYAPHRS